MRPSSSLFSIAAVAVTAFWFAAAIFMISGFAEAAERKAALAATRSVTTKDTSKPDPLSPPMAGVPSCSCPNSRERMGKPKFAGLSKRLDASDEVAALASLHMALNTAGDGQAYIWHRNNGKLSGFVKPVSTFRNADKLVCRHVEVMLTTGLRTDRIESTACRQKGGQWKLDG